MYLLDTDTVITILKGHVRVPMIFCLTKLFSRSCIYLPLNLWHSSTTENE